jgi:hypothetical protein
MSRDELSGWIRAAEPYMDSAAPSNALPYLHKAFVYSAECRDLRAVASLKLAGVCRRTGQHFIGSEFLREATYIARSTPQVMEALRLELTKESDAFAAHRGVVDLTLRDLICYITRVWHNMGIPFPPSEECLVLSNVYRVDEPQPFFSNISWLCLLPFEDPGGGNAFQALLTAFDIQLGPHVVQRFERTADVLQNGMDDSLELIATKRLATIGITLSISKEKLRALEEIGRQIFARGVPLDLVLEATPISGGGIEYLKAGLDAASNGADLFCLTLVRRAQHLFESERNTKYLLLARLHEALAMKRLRQGSEAASLALSIQSDAEQCGDRDISDAIRQNFPGLPNRDEGQRPFHWDASSGKIVGGALASEAVAEFEAGQLLNDAWEQDFPGTDSPFFRYLSANTFAWRDPSFSEISSTSTVDLGQLMRLSPGTLRLGDVRRLNVPPGYKLEDYIEMFVSRITAAILVAHKRLRGAYSSDAGTSISAGNVEITGHLCDYETFRCPSLGDDEDLRPAQINDLSNAVFVIQEFLVKLQRSDLLAETILRSAEVYCDTTELHTSLRERIGELATAKDDVERRLLITGYAKMLHATATWRM